MHINDLYRTVTNRIIEELERGALPWLKPWKSSGHNGSLMPRNAATGRSYRGINIPILWVAADRRGYATHAWMTFRQANERGGQVRRRSEEHTSELQSLMRNSYAVFCLTKNISPTSLPHHPSLRPDNVPPSHYL